MPLSLSFVRKVAIYHFHFQLFQWLPSIAFIAVPEQCPLSFLLQTFSSSGEILKDLVRFLDALATNMPGNLMLINCIVMVRSYQAAASRQSAKWQKLRLFSRASGENYDLESKDDAEKEGYLFLNRRRCPTSLYLSIIWLAHLQVVKI